MAHTQKTQANPSPPPPKKSLILEEPTTRSSIPMETRREPSYSKEHEPYRTLKKTAFAPQDSRKYGDLPAPQPMPRLCLCWTFSQAPLGEVPSSPEISEPKHRRAPFQLRGQDILGCVPGSLFSFTLDTDGVCVYPQTHTCTPQQKLVRCRNF